MAAREETHVVLVCDECGGKLPSFDFEVGWYANARNAREIAEHEYDWHVESGRDVCVECWED